MIIHAQTPGKDRILAKAIAAVVCAACVVAPQLVQAADPFPSRPIKLVVNSSPGGLTDVAARIILPQLTQLAGQPIVVDNRSNTVVGIDAVAKAPPDGYTVGIFASALTVLPALVSDLPFKPTTDLAPVSVVTSAPLVLVTGANSPYHTVADYVAAAKTKPGQITIASGGNGTMGHLLAEQLQISTGISLIHVPYKGGAPAMSDVMAGHVPAFFDVIGTSIPLVRGGKVRGLAIASPTRSPSLPEVPTLTEAGVQNVDGMSWFAMFAPAGTPPAIIKQINEWVGRAVQSPEVKERFIAIGAVPEVGPPDVLKTRVQAESVRWIKLVKDRNIKVN